MGQPSTLPGAFFTSPRVNYTQGPNIRRRVSSRKLKEGVYESQHCLSLASRPLPGNKSHLKVTGEPVRSARGTSAMRSLLELSVVRFAELSINRSMERWGVRCVQVCRRVVELQPAKKPKETQTETSKAKQQITCCFSSGPFLSVLPLQIKIYVGNRSNSLGNISGNQACGVSC